MGRKFAYIGLIIGIAVIFGCGETPQGTPDTPPPMASSTCEPTALSQVLPPNETTQSIASYYQGPLFSSIHNNQPDVSDVRQPGYNVCYFYAFLSAYVTHQRDNVKKSIKKIDGGFEVYVFDPSNTKSCVFISNQQLGIFRRNGKVQTNVLWPEVLAAAWASYLGSQDLKMIEDVAYEGSGTDVEHGRQELLLGKTIDMSLVRKDLFHYFLNKTGKVRRIKPKIGTVHGPNFVADHEALFRFVDSCTGANCIMYAYIAPGGEVPGPKTPNGLPSGLFDHHCYGVMGVDMPARSVSLRNPHGGSSARAVSYKSDGTMTPAIQVNERFSLRSQDFYRQFYTLQFSEF